MGNVFLDVSTYNKAYFATFLDLDLLGSKALQGRLTEAKLQQYVLYRQAYLVTHA